MSPVSQEFVNRRLSDGISSLSKRFPGSADLRWFLPSIRDRISDGIGRKTIEEKLTSVTGALELFPATAPQALELGALHGLLFEAERRLASEERLEADLGRLEALSILPTELDAPSLEQQRGGFLGDFLNDAVRDFSLEPVRGLMASMPFDRALPGLRGPLEEMARLAGFFAPERPSSFRGVVEQAAFDLPTISVGLISGPVSGRIVEDLLGDRGISTLADAVVNGKVSRLLASLEEDVFRQPEGMVLVMPPREIGMMQAQLTATERALNPGRSVQPGGPGGM